MKSSLLGVLHAPNTLIIADQTCAQLKWKENILSLILISVNAVTMLLICYCVELNSFINMKIKTIQFAITGILLKIYKVLMPMK